MGAAGERSWTSIIFMSTSLREMIDETAKNINENFARLIRDRGSDHRFGRECHKTPGSEFSYAG